MEKFTQLLLDNDSKMSYLKKRGVTEELVREFELGYIPNGQALELQDGVKLWGSGILFPIKDLFEEVIGYITRRDEGVKFMKSSFFSSKYLFGLNKTWKSILETGSAIVVEGLFDFLVLYGNGIRNVVGMMTNSLSKEQAWQLSIFCNNCTVVYDGDNKRGRVAGREYLTVVEKKVPFLFDPDEFLLKFGVEQFNKFIINI